MADDLPVAERRAANCEPREEIARLTEEYGGVWGINHTRRLLRLIETIGEGLAYDRDVVWLAAHLHDWGAYAKWAAPSVDHAARSREVAAGFLAERDFAPGVIERVLECIATHHSGDPNRSLEAILLSDADGLDFLGFIGVARDFSKNARDLRGAYQSVKKRREKVPGLLCLDKTKALAAERLARLDAFLAGLEEETGGDF